MPGAHNSCPLARYRVMLFFQAGLVRTIQSEGRHERLKLAIILNRIGIAGSQGLFSGFVLRTSDYKQGILLTSITATGIYGVVMR